MKTFIITFLAASTICLAEPPDDQQLIGKWKTRENIDLVFTKEHTFTMKSADLPRGAAGKWILHADGEIELVINAELNSAMQQKPVPEKVLRGQKLTVTNKDMMQVSAPDGTIDMWKRTP